ncbi:MAG: insulinase family protein [Clostridia bacterium]|nr:insulinase family protein [Clostridia bacterium]
MTEKTLADGVKYSFVKTDRFKTTVMSIGFYLPLSRNNAANTLALNLMKSGTESLPDTYSFQRRLASLYGASAVAWTAKIGDCQELRIALTVNDDRYSLNAEPTVNLGSQLLCDMVFGRVLSDTDYPKEAVLREKRLLKENILAKLNDKRTYARNRCEQIMCEGEGYGLDPEGNIDDVDRLENADIREALKRLTEEAFVSVQVIGAAEPSDFARLLAQNFTKINRRFAFLPLDTVKASSDLKEVTEKMPVKQGKLVMGFKNGIGGNDRDTVADWIMTDIFGGGPYSKLFCNVREKLSLCYYCSARPTRRKGIIVVDSGVEEANIEAARIAILQQLSDMADGNFEDKDINSSKLSLCDTIGSVESDQNMLLRWYASRSLDEAPVTPDEMCRLINKVTREDIMAAAKNFTLDTIYTLRPDGSESEAEQ